MYISFTVHLVFPTDFTFLLYWLFHKWRVYIFRYKNQHDNILVLIVKQLSEIYESEFSPRFQWSPCCSICSVCIALHCLCFCILFLSIVCLFFIDLRIHSHSFLTYDPDKHIGLVQRRHDHKLVLAMILLTHGSLGIIINRIFNI